jgi:hypothetical protein
MDRCTDRPVSDGDGRDRKTGRWIAGNRASPGNPHARRMFTLRKALLDSASVEDVQAVGAKLVELAKAGDVQAAKVWLAYVIGKPFLADELTEPDTCAVQTLLATVATLTDFIPTDRQAAAMEGIERMFAMAEEPEL